MALLSLLLLRMLSLLLLLSLLSRLSLSSSLLLIFPSGAEKVSLPRDGLLKLRKAIRKLARS